MLTTKTTHNLLRPSSVMLYRRRCLVSPMRQQHPAAAQQRRRNVTTSTSPMRMGALSPSPTIQMRLLPTTTTMHRYSWLFGGTALGIVAGGGCAIGQYYYGYEKDFFQYHFIIGPNIDNPNDSNQLNQHTIDPDDLASFYGGEEFMELFCVVPLMGTLMMRGGHFDDEGTVHTTGFPGEMQVSMVFSDETDEVDGKTKWFNKRERFRDVLFGSYTCWDMVTNFGFERLPDGRLKVYHHGEYFKSNFPPFSLLARLVFGLHARWVAWATEHYLNHYAFADNDQDEELEEQARRDMPLFLLTHYAPSDLMAAFFGNTSTKKPSFLLRRDQDEARALQTVDLELSRLLPVYRPRLQRHITIDIQQDRANAKSALQHRDTIDKNGDTTTETALSSTTPPPVIPLHIGLHRTETLTRRLTNAGTTESLTMEDEECSSTLGRQHKGGSTAWESVRSTNDPKAYQAVTRAARERHLQRKATKLVSTTENNQIEDDCDPQAK